MTGHEPATTRSAAGADHDPFSPLDELVSAMVGRVRDLRTEVRGGGLILHGHILTTAAGRVESVTLLRESARDVVVLDTDLPWGGAGGGVTQPRTGEDARVPVF